MMGKINLQDCVSDSKGVWPEQLRQSGIRFYNGTRITIDEFEKEAKRQRYKFRVG